MINTRAPDGANKYMSRMNSADKENIPCESLHRDQIFTSQFIL